MNEETQLKIQAWVDGELSGWQARNVAKLVERDADAKALATELRQTKTAFAGNEVSVALPELREFYWNKIRLQIEREEAAGQKRVSPAPSWDPLSIFRRIGLPLAGVAVAAGVALLTLTQFSGPRYEEVTTTSDDMTALTFHDQSAGMTVIWLQDKNDQPATDENLSDSEDVI
jgi:anti-sigma-K factor RskA